MTPSSEATPRPRPQAIKSRDFRDIMAVMMNIDLYVLEDAGVIAKGNVDNGGNSWKRFNDDPLRFVLKLDDEKLEALTTLVNERRRAVKSYDESRELLREAAGLLLVAAATGTDDDMVGQFRRCRDRITAHLEAGK